MSVCGKGRLHGLWTLALSACRVLSWPFLGVCAQERGEGRGRSCHSSFSYKDTKSIRSGLTLMTSFNLNFSHKGPISRYSHSGSGFNIQILEGNQHSVHNIVFFS